MKKKSITFLIVLFTLSFTFIGCNDPGANNTPTNNPTIIGTWEWEDQFYTEKTYIEFKQNGTFEAKGIFKGIYTANAGNKKITMTITDIHGKFLNEMYEEQAAEDYEILGVYLTFKDQYYTKAQFTAALTENIAALSEALSELMGKGKNEEVLAAFIEEMKTEMTASIDEMFSEQTGAYKISADNKRLTLKFDGEDIVLTRK